jgi:hypothetical protein
LLKDIPDSLATSFFFIKIFITRRPPFTSYYHIQWDIQQSNLVVNALRGLSTFSLLLYSLYAVCAFIEMALGNLAQRVSRTSVEENDNNIDEKDKTLDSEDVEGQPPRRMSRIDGVDGGSDVDVSLGALIEAEKDNSIKYRTCSWQKVRLNSHK